MSQLPLFFKIGNLYRQQIEDNTSYGVNKTKHSVD